ncbi:hypothetical protein BKA69DRAFT_1037900 [Paraphysoderma sedebokerense]|nr:hypothetical protein BKA69DRAFT_1037900 [Paraphysoderma sedebokerense]
MRPILTSYRYAILDQSSGCDDWFDAADHRLSKRDRRAESCNYNFLYLSCSKESLNAKLYIVQLSNAQEDGSKIIKVDNRVPLDSESFAAIISHELRTPIHGIINCIDMIQDTNLSPDQQCYVSIIQNCSQTLHSIINHVLHHSRLDSNSYNAVITSFPVCRVVQSVGETIEPVADKKGLSVMLILNGRFILNVNTDSDDYCWVAGDENGLRQALINLAGNAVKFTSEGYVTISLDIDPPTPRSQVPENVLSLYPNLVADVFYSICFTVNDTGSGMSPSFTTRCFEPYAQELPPLHRSQGTGLGLSIVKKWVEANGGEVFIKSELHEGTMIGFRMWFPRGEGKFENLEELNLQNIVVGCVQSGNIVAKESNGELLTSEKTTIARPLIMDGIIAGLIKRHIKSAFLDAHLWLNSCHTCNCDRSFRRECYSVPDRQNLTFHESYLSPKFQPQNFPLSISQHFSVANPPSNHSSLNEPHHLDILIIEDNISLLRHFIHDPRVSFEKVLFIASVSTISSAYKEMLDLLSTDWKEGNGKVMIIAKPAVERKVVHALRDLRKGEGVVTVDENQTTAEPQGTIVTGKKENLISDMTKLNGLAGRNRNRLSELDDRLMDDLQVIDITSSSIQSHHTSQELIGLFKKQYRVLVVEDNPINATILCKHLCKNGFKVDTVTNGCEAVDKVKETLYSSDRSMSFYGLILMDIQMPIMDGIEATKRIRTLESSFMASTPVVPKTPSCCSTHQTLSESKLWFRPSTIVAFTGLSLLSDKEKAFQAGCQYFLNKPLRFHQLQETLDEAIRMRFSS